MGFLNGGIVSERKRRSYLIYFYFQGLQTQISAGISGNVKE